MDTRKSLTLLRIAIAAILTVFSFSPAKAQDLKIVTFGGAGLDGNYYAFAKALCKEINALERDDLRCSPEATPGSLYNLFAMQRGELDFALVQSDWQRAAVEGTGPFAKDGPVTGLRSVISLYQEALTLVARRDSDIQTLSDLKGKVLDIGHPSTGRRVTTQRLVEALDFQAGDVEMRGLVGPALVEAMCTGTVDATMIVFGHPNPAVGKALADCNLVLLPVLGDKVNALVDQNEEYNHFLIPAQTYPDMAKAVPTFAVSATLMVRDSLDDEIVELFLTTLFDNYDTLRDTIGALPPLNPLKQRSDGLMAPMHRGAVAVFDKMGG